MNFVEAKLVPESGGAKRAEVLEMLGRFLESDLDGAEVKDWEETFKSLQTAYLGVRDAIKAVYPTQLKTIKCGDHIYIKRISE